MQYNLNFIYDLLKAQCTIKHQLRVVGARSAAGGVFCFSRMLFLMLEHAALRKGCAAAGGSVIEKNDAHFAFRSTRA